MGDAPGALGGAIPWDKTLRGCCVLLPKRTILVCASVWYQSQGRYMTSASKKEIKGYICKFAKCIYLVVLVWLCHDGHGWSFKEIWVFNFRNYF